MSFNSHSVQTKTIHLAFDFQGDNNIQVGLTPVHFNIFQHKFLKLHIKCTSRFILPSSDVDENSSQDNILKSMFKKRYPDLESTKDLINKELNVVV